MKELLLNPSNMAMGSRDLQMETIIEENIKKENSMGRASMFGPMAPRMKEVSWKGAGMGKEIGSHQEAEETSILELMKGTRNVATDGMFGQMDASMRGSSKVTLSTSYLILETGKDASFTRTENRSKECGKAELWCQMTATEKFPNTKNPLSANRFEHLLSEGTRIASTVKDIDDR